MCVGPELAAIGEWIGGEALVDATAGTFLAGEAGATAAGAAIDAAGVETAAAAGDAAATGAAGVAGGAGTAAAETSGITAKSLLSSAGQVASGVNAATGLVTALSGKAGAPPSLVRSNPLADQAAADTLASQNAQKAKLDAQRRARANSLLSTYGGAGDTSAVASGAGGATGKLALGA